MYPIEKTYPIEEVNAIAAKESTGFGRRWYRPIYIIHKWWARRLGSVFRAILLYSLADEGDTARRDTLFQEGDDELWPAYFQDVHFEDKVVLDPMMGGGTTIVEALRFGSKVIGCDLNPVAWFVVKKEIEPIDLEAFQKEYDRIADNIEKEITATYKTTCPDCKGEAVGMYYFWVKELPCPNCQEKVSLFSDYKVASGPKVDGKTSRFVFCPECESVVNTPGWTGEQVCPECSHHFDPSKGAPVSGGDMICPYCGQNSEIVETIREHGKPSQRLYAMEYYCLSCDENNYKSIDQEDVTRYKEAKSQFIRDKNTYSIPDAEIPKGQETYPRLDNHGYKLFSDLFNKRQLLNLGKILQEIKIVEDENIQEYLLLAFSNTLKYNCMFAKYDRSNNYVTDIFRTHAYHPSLSPVEANCFDLPKGRGSFRAFVNLVTEAKEWCQEPFDRDSSSEKHFFDTKVSTRPALTVEDFEESGKRSLLLSQSSNYLGLEDQSVDAVITDPPYKGNVNYAELADFFYVWLRLILKDRYPHFQAQFTPKRSEVIENPVRGKDTEDFIEGLTEIFNESERVLKDDGIMVFTFHHRETEAWASVLQSVLDAGFYISAIYPVRAEMAASTHIYAKGNIEYDMIIVCRKRTEVSEPKSWRSIEDDIYFRVEEIVRSLEEKEKRLSSGDIFTVAIGKCLEVYSKHYPNVKRDGEIVEVEEALSHIPAIVDGQLSQSRYEKLVAELDTMTALYLSYVIGRGKKIPYSELNKEFQQRNISLNKLIEANLLEKEGNDLVVLSEEKRADVIRDKDPLDLYQIDRAHFLYYLSQYGNLARDGRQWATKESLQVMEHLADSLTNSSKAKRYRELKEHLEKLLAWET